MMMKTSKKEKYKDGNVNLIFDTYLKALSIEYWYFDSGCSRSFITIGDGAKGEIKGLGKLVCI